MTSTADTDQASSNTYSTSSGEPSPSSVASIVNVAKGAAGADSLALLNRSPDAQSVKRMRRNESAAAALQSLGQAEASATPGGDETGGSNTGGMRKNKSYAVLTQAEKSGAFTSGALPPAAEATRALVCDACALHLFALMKPPDNEGNSSSLVLTMKTYIETICRQLSLPNSCIITMVLYVERLVANPNFQLTELNWQPSLLSGFVVAAKLCFDEPVWNEDFLRALRISNVQVRQISRWEVNFLKLIDFNTNVDLSDYANLTFRLQERFFKARGERVHFFSFLMNVCRNNQR